MWGISRLGSSLGSEILTDLFTCARATRAEIKILPLPVQGGSEKPLKKVESEGKWAQSPFGEIARGKLRFLEISQSLLSPSLSSYHKLIWGLLLIFCTPDVGCSWGRDSGTLPARSWNVGEGILGSCGWVEKERGI